MNMCLCLDSGAWISAHFSNIGLLLSTKYIHGLVYILLSQSSLSPHIRGKTFCHVNAWITGPYGILFTARVVLYVYRQVR